MYQIHLHFSEESEGILRTKDDDTLRHLRGGAVRRRVQHKGGKTRGWYLAVRLLVLDVLRQRSATRCRCGLHLPRRSPVKLSV